MHVAIITRVGVQWRCILAVCDGIDEPKRSVVDRVVDLATKVRSAAQRRKLDGISHRGDPQKVHDDRDVHACSDARTQDVRTGAT